MSSSREEDTRSTESGGPPGSRASGHAGISCLFVLLVAIIALFVFTVAIVVFTFYDLS